MSASSEERTAPRPATPLRIGLVTPAWPGSRTANGIATAVSHIAAGLEACGHEVTIIAFSIDAPHDHPRVVHLPDLPWSFLDKLRVRLDPEATAHGKLGDAIAVAVQEAIEHHGIEVVVMEETQGWVGIVSRRAPIPVVATLHGPWCLHKEIQGNGDAQADARREAREREALRRVKGISAPSRDTLDRTSELWDLPEGPRAVIQNPMPVGPETNVDGPANLLFVGRFDYHKGGDVVIEAFEEIARRHPSCRLTFVGPDKGIERPGFPRLTLAEAIARLPEAIQARIDIRGQCSREEVAALRLTHGMTVVASRYENFGGTMLEAMAVGAALVCTRVGGGAEILTDEETALLVPTEDPQAIAEACLRLLNDPDLARRLGIAARSYVEKNLSPEVIGRQMAEFIEPLCRK